MTTYLDFQDGNGWRNVSSLARDDSSIIDRAMSDDYHKATNVFSFNLLYDTTIFTLIRGATKNILVKAMEGATTLFTGYFKPNTSISFDGLADLQLLSIEAQDFTTLLDVNVGTEEDDDIALENYKILDSTDTAHSLVHAVFTKAGLSSALIDASVTISGIVPAFTSASPDDKLGDLLDTCLHEYGYVCNWNSAGLFHPKQWILPSGTLPEFEFNDDNIMLSISEDSDDREFEGTEVTWYGLDTKLQTRVYTENLPFADDGAFDGYAVLGGFFYPPEANVIDDTTGDYQKVYQEYTDDGIRYKTSKYVQDEYVMDFALAHADFSEILITKNHTIEEKLDAGLVRDVTTYKNKRCRIRYDNPNVTSRLLYYMNVCADTVFKRSQQKCRILPAGGTQKIEKYESRFVFDINTADALCRAYYNRATQGRYEYSFDSLEEVEDGTYVSLVLGNGVTATGHVMERVYDNYTGVYSYKVRGYSSSYLAVTGRTVITASISGDDATTISLNKPSTPSASFAGDNIFRYYEGHTVPTNLYLELDIILADTNYVVDSYQWYYRDGLGADQSIPGATAATLNVPYNAAYLQGNQTILSCVINGKYAYSTTVITTYDPNRYDLRITSPVTAISYNKDGSSPTPAGQANYQAVLYENDSPLASGVSYAWMAGGSLSVASGISAQTMTADIAATYGGSSFVSCEATFGENVRASYVAVSASYYDETLDWNIEWDATKDEMYSGDILIGESVIAARMYSGTLEDDPAHPGFKRLLNGIALGSNLQVKGPSGTESKSGFVTVQNGVITAFMDTDGNATWNGVITASGVNSSIQQINQSLSISDAGFSATASGTLSAGATRAYLDTNEVAGQTYDGDSWEKSAELSADGNGLWGCRTYDADGNTLSQEAASLVARDSGNIEKVAMEYEPIREGLLLSGKALKLENVSVSRDSYVVLSGYPGYGEPCTILRPDGYIEMFYIETTSPYVIRSTEKLYTHGWEDSAWSSPITVVSGIVSPYRSYDFPVAEVLFDGSTICIYRAIQNLGTEFGLFYKIRTAGVWGSEQSLTAFSSINLVPVCLLKKKDGTLHFICMQLSGTTVIKETIINASGSFSVITDIPGTTNAFYQLNISMIQKESGELALYYTNSALGYITIIRTVDGEWQTPQVTDIISTDGVLVSQKKRDEIIIIYSSNTHIIYAIENDSGSVLSKGMPLVQATAGSSWASALTLPDKQILLTYGKTETYTTLMGCIIDQYTPIQPQGRYLQFSPSLYGATTPGTPTYSTREGDYILREEGGYIWCEYWARVLLSDKSTISGEVRITLPVPYKTVNGVDQRTAAIGYFAGITLPSGSTTMGALSAKTENAILLYSLGSPSNRLLGTALANTTHIQIYCKYIADL